MKDAKEHKTLKVSSPEPSQLSKGFSFQHADGAQYVGHSVTAYRVGLQCDDGQTKLERVCEVIAGESRAGDAVVRVPRAEFLQLMDACGINASSLTSVAIEEAEVDEIDEQEHVDPENKGPVVKMSVTELRVVLTRFLGRATFELLNDDGSVMKAYKFPPSYFLGDVKTLNNEQQQDNICPGCTATRDQLRTHLYTCQRRTFYTNNRDWDLTKLDTAKLVAGAGSDKTFCGSLNSLKTVNELKEKLRKVDGLILLNNAKQHLMTSLSALQEPPSQIFSEAFRDHLVSLSLSNPAASTLNGRLVHCLSETLRNMPLFPPAFVAELDQLDVSKEIQVLASLLQLKEGRSDDPLYSQDSFKAASTRRKAGELLGNMVLDCTDACRLVSVFDAVFAIVKTSVNKVQLLKIRGDQEVGLGWRLQGETWAES
jgi:hypothetical protein